MSKIDYSDLDGKALRAFLVVFEEESVSKAAIRLGVSQSAVSHTLEKLRSILNDALFERSGRGIQPTDKAQSLEPEIRLLLDHMRSLTYQKDFDPTTESMRFTIATNDFPLQLIFPTLLTNLAAEGIHPELNFIPSGVPGDGSLRTSRYQMMITPVPPRGDDVNSVRLLESKMTCFYDSTMRKPPGSWKQFVACKYVEVRFSDTESSMMVLPIIDRSALNAPTITVPNFSSLASFVKNSDLITVQLEVMRLGLLKGLDVAPLPLKTDPLGLFLTWHKRHEDDPAHKWLRHEIVKTTNSMILR
jgi:DNA-binding transcriptional LysR family regulator